ncbi:MAG: D-alanyl-D-alanine carboxypeptidase [Patescibacteria group bacterium]|nr:D-alanyl-D-alanine carboxypeptidase [Patescibacteria group bacterium]
MDNLKPIIKILSHSWKPFVVALVFGFAMTFIQSIKAHQQAATQPLVKPAITVDRFNDIRAKLAQTANNFQIKEANVQTPVDTSADFNQASAYAVVDADTGQVIAGKNLNQRLPMASLTKMMTAVVVMDLASPNDQFTVSQNAANVQPTRMGVVPGQKWSRNELLNAMLLTSANDVAQVFKDNIDQKYGNGTFIKAMNIKAEVLGLKNTHFDNPQGFDADTHFSSVEDLAILANYALKNYPTFREIVTKDYQFYPATSTHKQADLYNWNGLLDVYPGVAGVKIGNTEKAGNCTVVFSERGGKRLLAVVLGAPGVLERDMWAAELLDFGFEKSAGLPPVNVTKDQLQTKYDSWKYFG